MINPVKQAFSTLYLSPRFFIGIGALVLLFVLAFILPWLFLPAKIILLVFCLISLVELVFLYGGRGIEGQRVLAAKFSNGDDNPIQLILHSFFAFPCQLEVYDELPPEWQVRDFYRSLNLKSGETQTVRYTYRPTRRGAFSFGHIQVLARIGTGLVQRKIQCGAPEEIVVFPSYLSMLKYEYLAISNTLIDSGIKKIRRIGQHSEFEKIKDYVPGDDFRTINWKATARRGKLMANLFQDERSQQVYCIIDKGRVMNQPFENMTLLDHAINASLVLANIAIKKYDKAGLLTFDEEQVQMLGASRKSGHMLQFQELLYRQTTRFLESDYERLYLKLKHQVTQRSLLILFTNFDTVSSMQRRLPYIKAMAKNHLLLVVFFENTETLNLIHKKAKNTHDVYRKMVAEKVRFEKEQIVAELRKNGILSLLSSPADLTLNTINRYLELKARGMI